MPTLKPPKPPIPLEGYLIQCPHCHRECAVYHLNWTSLLCLSCKERIDNPFEEEEITVSQAMDALKQIRIKLEQVAALLGKYLCLLLCALYPLK